MAKRKHPIHHLHKIQVHHNRWLAWAISYTIIVAIALVGYIKVSTLNSDLDLTAENNYTAWHSYKDQRLGFSLRYPAHWSIEANSESSIIFEPTDSQDSGVTVTVVDLSDENLVRQTLEVVSEKSIMIAGAKAVQIQNQVNGKYFESVVLIKNDSNLYVVRGTKNLVDKILETFSLSSK